MIRSIKARLLLGTIGAMALLLIVFALILYEVLQRSFVVRFDEVLTSTAHTICSFIEQDEEGVTVETDERQLPEFYRAERPDYFELWDERGNIVARSRSLGGATTLERFQGAPDSFVFRPASLPDGRRGRAVSFFFQPRIDDEATGLVTPRRLILVVARDTATLDSEVSLLRTLLATVTGGTILLALIVGLVVVRQSLRPLGALASRIARIRQDDLSVRIPSDTIATEMQPVVDKLNDLLSRLEEALDRERALTADVAHELRTPLAGLRSVMEVSLTRPRLSDDYRQALCESLDIVGHAQTMVDNLLELSRLDRGLASLHPERLLLSEALESAWRPLRHKTLARGLAVENSVPVDLEFSTDRNKLMVTLGILLANAVEYANENGWIEVFARLQGESVEIEVANSGCQLSVEQAQHVFERFWRGDASRTNTGVHFGLGLATAKLIVNALSGRIAAEVKDNIFTIRIFLPASTPSQFDCV